MLNTTMEQKWNLLEGDTYFLAPGHDAWVVGDKEVIGYEFITDDKDFGPWKKA